MHYVVTALEKKLQESNEKEEKVMEEHGMVGDSPFFNLSFFDILNCANDT